MVAIFEQPVYPDENEIRRLQTLVSQSAIALQNLRSLEDTIRKAAQLETAAEIARDTSSTLSLDDLLNRSVNAVRERFGYYHASIFLLDESKQFAVVQASTGEAGAQMIAQKHKLQVGSNSIIGRVTGNGESLVVNDVRQNANHRPHPLLPDTKAELGIPLKIGARVIGALDVQDDDENTFREDDIIVLRTLADQISVAIDNAQSYARVEQAVEETRQRVQELTLIAKASETLASAPLETREIAATIAQQLLEILPNHNSASITLQQGDEMIPLAIVERKNGQLQQHENPEKRNFNLNDYPATRSVLENLTHQVFNISAENIPAEEKAHMQRYNIGSLAIMPLSVKGQSIGIIDLESSQPYHFSAEEFNLITTIANQAGISIDNARLYEEQTETAEQLRELDRLKSQFLANMSHELRTPLNSIIGFSRVIMKGIDGPVTDLQHQDLSAIYNAGQHLLKMINDILDISKIDAGKMELAFEDVILDDVVNSVMSTARGLVKDKPVQLVTAIEENLPMITADSTRIRQILLNFLSNAAKFTDEGSITVTVRKQLNENNAPEIYIAVTDTGIGIAPADQKDLFEPFTQVDGSATRASGGTGLGLSITRLLVELHGGRIGIDSDIGKGSTFYFTLPIQDEAPPQNTQGQTTVLAMDDDQQVLQLYERYLGGSEFTLVKLTEPQRTVELAIEIQPFAIMLDIMLPNHDGWQILEELQNTPQTRNIPVIICSIADEVEKGFDLGATDYLKKPILAEDLLNSLSRIQEYS